MFVGMLGLRRPRPLGRAPSFHVALSGYKPFNGSLKGAELGCERLPNQISKFTG